MQAVATRPGLRVTEIFVATCCRIAILTTGYESFHMAQRVLTAQGTTVTTGDMSDERFAKRLGSLIRQRRIDMGLSQQELADGVGVHQAAVSVWEIGRSTPTGRCLIGLARELNLEIAEIQALLDQSDDGEAA